MSSSRAIDSAEGLVAFLGILFGLIPMTGWVIAGEHNGPFRLVFGSPQAPGAYLIPLGVIAGAVLIIAGLELAKKRKF